MSEPRWYRELDHQDQEIVDQVAHVAMGFFAALIFGLLIIWWREWVHQWPPGKPYMSRPVGRPDQLVTQLDRVEDTKRDLYFTDIGYTVGQVVQVILLVWLI